MTADASGGTLAASTEIGADLRHVRSWVFDLDM
ncbi:MAG TPA: pyrimidine 5'-nucleotidase, partial [Brevundimonas sp.]|nr:pyrimidine 5'-nucleotidase [Brevundimonas sp.]